MGFLAGDRLQDYVDQGVYVLTRVPAWTAFFERKGRGYQRLDLLKRLRGLEGNGGQRPVYVFHGQKVGLRLLAVRVPPEVAQQRRQRMRREAKERGRPVSQKKLDLYEWTVLATNTPEGLIGVREAFEVRRVRWQVELVFELFKSEGGVGRTRSGKPWRVLAELFAKLLAMMVQQWLLLAAGYAMLRHSGRRGGCGGVRAGGARQRAGAGAGGGPAHRRTEGGTAASPVATKSRPPSTASPRSTPISSPSTRPHNLNLERMGENRRFGFAFGHPIPNRDDLSELVKPFFRSAQISSFKLRSTRTTPKGDKEGTSRLLPSSHLARLAKMYTPSALLLALVLVSPAEAAPPPAALPAWQKGQEALDADRLDEAVGQFRLALRLDPGFVRARLGLAAAHLALGQDREAIPQLAAYLRARPEHFLVRMPYAEVLSRLERYAEARIQLERFVAAVQEHPRLADDHLLACHTRLMEIAERLGDEYGERLHRGIGLHLLAVKRLQIGGPTSKAVAEELLCKSASELTLARLLEPSEARPWWYLHLVWTRLGQSHPAQRSLHAAEACLGIDQLTPTERCDLHLRLETNSLSTLRR